MTRSFVMALISGVALLTLNTPASAENVPYSSLKWRALGPAISGGRAAAVAGTDADPLLYYTGAAGGGIWRSTDAGASWKAVFESLPVNSIGAVAIAASNKNVVWLGTGEANPRSDVSWGDGVWLSTDGGDHWKHRGLDDTSQISRILVDPRNPNVALVGALGDPFKDSEERGVYRTTDGGNTWTKTLYVGPRSGASDLAWDPKHPNVVFAGIWQYHRFPWLLDSGGPDGGIYRSNDAGITWTKLTGNGLPDGLTGRIGIAVAAGHPQRVYAIIQSKSGVLWRSDDGGNTWRWLSSDTVLNQRPFYFSRLAVDPSNQDHVIVLSEWLMESTNGGRTFKHIGKSVHVDHHDLWWSADGRRIVEADDGGVVTSFDRGKNWNYPGNLPIGQFYRIGYDTRVPYNVCGGLQDNTTMCGPSNSLDSEGILNRDWTSVNGGDGQAAWPDPLDPSLIWNEVENGELGIFGLHYQQNVDVSPYPRDTNGIALAGLPYRWNWTSPIAFSWQDPHIFYAGANVVFKTTDRGRHWTAISPDLTRNETEHQQVSGGPINPDVAGAEFFNTITDISPSPLQEGMIWVGSDDGLIHLTTDGGAHWKDVTPSGIEPYGFVQNIDPSPHAPGTAYVAIDRHLMGDRAPHILVTEDFGTTWRAISSGLPADQPARAIRQDPRNGDVLYAGLEQGIWISFDRGAAWQSFQLDLPTASVRDIRIHPVANDLIIGTHGRSIYVFDDLTPIQQLASARAAGTYLFQPRTAYNFWQFSREDSQDNLAPANTFAADVPDVGVMINYYLDKPASTRPEIEIRDANGHVVRRLSGTHLVSDSPEYYVKNKAGINRITWDLAETGPVKRLSAPHNFQGSDDGPTVVPGTYRITLHVDGHAYERSVKVMPDPRAPWTQADYVARHDFEAALDNELSQVDTALNSLDAIRRDTNARIKPLRNASPPAAIVAQGDVLVARATAIVDEMTSNPRNDEDGVLYPDKTRERIETLLGYLGESQQPPFTAHREQADEIKAEVARVLGDYDKFVREDVAQFNASLRAAGLQPLKM